MATCGVPECDCSKFAGRGRVVHVPLDRAREYEVCARMDGRWITVVDRKYGFVLLADDDEARRLGLPARAA